MTFIIRDAQKKFLNFKGHVYRERVVLRNLTPLSQRNTLRCYKYHTGFDMFRAKPKVK